MLHEFKVVVVGAFGAGKTSLINSVCHGPVVGTEVPTTGPEADLKATTTVGVEFGSHRVEGEDLAIDLHLFGVPGQDRFRAMWDIIAHGMDGFVVLVDGSRPETWPAAAQVAEHFASRSDAPSVIGINRLPADVAASVVAEAIAHHADDVVEVDVLDPTSARDLVVRLLMVQLDRMETEEG